MRQYEQAIFYTVWDKENNGVFLTSDSKNALKINPRPVFYEELNLFGFNKFWNYPQTEEPLLWRAGRRYYYKGEFVAEAKGGNIYEKPQIKITDAGKNLNLEPIDIRTVVNNNKEQLSILENEAMQFVNHIFDRYTGKVSAFVVSYSGGKDSQVVLDIVSRTVEPEKYIVVFTDTTMEIPPTYETFEKTKKEYPNLQFYTAKNWKPAEETWKEFGTPSRLFRWCCAVHKSAPMIRLVRELIGKSNNVRVVVFEGVRKEESARRRGYLRITENGKHFAQINAEAIEHWTGTEVFLYLLDKGIPLNNGYRLGLDRVGCSICPFASPWSEHIINKRYPETVKSLIDQIEKSVELMGIEQNEIKKYVSQGNWKMRAGSYGVDVGKTRLDTIKTGNNVKFILKHPQEDIKEWLKVLDNQIFRISIDKTDKRTVVDVKNIRDKKLLSKLVRVMNKATYCVHCGVCQVECPSGALSVIPRVSIDTSKCIHCYNCLEFEDKGCVRAKSMGNLVSAKKKGNILSFGSYLSFGLHDEWLKDFMIYGENWLIENDLEAKEVEAMLSWLRDAELMDSKTKNVTPFYSSLKRIFDRDEQLAFSMLWVNLFYNSAPVFWYLKKTAWNKTYSLDELKQLIEEQNLPLTKRIISSGITALYDTVKCNKYLNQLGIVSETDETIYRTTSDNIKPEAVLYSLYKFAVSKGSYEFIINELYDEANNKHGGVYVIFGMERPRLEHLLQELTQKFEDVISMDATGNIRLLNSSIDTIKLLDKHM